MVLVLMMYEALYIILVDILQVDYDQLSQDVDKFYNLNLLW